MSRTHWTVDMDKRFTRGNLKGLLVRAWVSFPTYAQCEEYVERINAMSASGKLPFYIAEYSID